MSDQKERFLTDYTDNTNIYLLGFLWADGYVGKKYDIRIEINESDFKYIQPLLEKYGFNSFNSRQRYKHGNAFGSVQKQFCISDAQLNKKLQALGYREKSHVAPNTVLSIIPENKRYLWWRGFFDGDGCFYCRGATHAFTVWGSLNQDWSKLLSLYVKLGIHSSQHIIYKRRNGKHSSSCVTVTKQDDIRKLGEYIYSNNPTIGFTRKHDNYKKCIDSPKPLFKKRKSSKKGVYFSIWTGKWICRKTINHKRKVIGSYSNYEEACHAFDKTNSIV